MPITKRKYHWLKLNEKIKRENAEIEKAKSQTNTSGKLSGPGGIKRSIKKK